ncbi:MAG: thymidine kinase, partial [Betaproteobacteria bacterium]
NREPALAKLYFRFAAMNAGKSTSLQQVAYNYEERGQTVNLFTAAIDDRYGAGRIVSRLGVERESEVFSARTDFTELYKTRALPSCILIDEAQFMTEAQVVQLHELAHTRGTPVICYGLRSDFLGQPFPGSKALLTLADDLEEMKTICRCGRKATMNVRLDANGNRVTEGEQVEIGGNDRYEAVCPRRFYTGQC